MGQTDEQTDISISNRMLLPVKIEAIGTPSSVDSAELNPITVVTQLQNGQAKEEEDIIRIHHQSAENGEVEILHHLMPEIIRSSFTLISSSLHQQQYFVFLVIFSIQTIDIILLLWFDTFHLTTK